MLLLKTCAESDNIRYFRTTSLHVEEDGDQAGQFFTLFGTSRN